MSKKRFIFIIIINPNFHSFKTFSLNLKTLKNAIFFPTINSLCENNKIYWIKKHAFSTFKNFFFEKSPFFGFINRFFRFFGFVFGFLSVQPKPNRKTDFFRFPVTDHGVLKIKYWDRTRASPGGITNSPCNI